MHEVYLRLVDCNQVDWRDRAHFLGIAAHIIRQILVDHAHSRLSAKRGGGTVFLQLEENLAGQPKQGMNLVTLDDALSDLARIDGQQAKVVEMRLPCGPFDRRDGEAMSISVSTVKRDWAVEGLLHRAQGSRIPGLDEHRE